MGSSGTGNFSDYSAESTGMGSGGMFDKGEDDYQDHCLEATTIDLEDVERNSYYRTHRAIPENGIQVQIEQRGRIVAITSNGEVLGLVPTAYNYLAGCLKRGLSYSGFVVSSTSVPYPRIQINITPNTH